jgi:ribosomal protein L29
MDTKTMQKKTVTELHRHAEKLATKLASMQTDRYLKEIKNIREIRAIRRERARALTIAHERAQSKDKEI